MEVFHMETILRVESLKKHYGKEPNITKALNGISFQVVKGEFLGIMGAVVLGKQPFLTVSLLSSNQLTAPFKCKKKI